MLPTPVNVYERKPSAGAGAIGPGVCSPPAFRNCADLAFTCFDAAVKRYPCFRLLIYQVAVSMRAGDKRPILRCHASASTVGIRFVSSLAHPGLYGGHRFVELPLKSETRVCLSVEQEGRTMGQASPPFCGEVLPNVYSSLGWEQSALPGRLVPSHLVYFS